jgi:sigma-B regulation protein RsbU (phosphoserine phosphatase)
VPFQDVAIDFDPQFAERHRGRSLQCIVRLRWTGMNTLASNVASLSSEELARRLEGLLRLLSVTRSLAAQVDPDTLLSTIIEQACEALDCERASLYQYDPETDELYTSVVTDLEIEEIRRPLSRGITGRVARTRQAANVPCPEDDPDWDDRFDCQTGFHTRNILAVPLTSPHVDSLLGVLQLLNKRDGAFDAVDEQLVAGFSQHAAVALDRARLVRELRQREATIASLDVARRVQQSFMPKRLPDVPGYELATWWFPNEAVGGDYCDVVELCDGRIGLVMADVSGHGLGPSLMMASVRAALRALALEHASTDELMKLLGRSLAPDLARELFITMILAALDPVGHTLAYTNAGHGPTFVYSPGSSSFMNLEATGLPLGVLNPPEFAPARRLEIARGDLVFFCTDGVVEAPDGGGQQFGQRRLMEFIRRHAEVPVQQLVEMIGAAVGAHYVGESPPDDLTILAARRLS